MPGAEGPLDPGTSLISHYNDTCLSPARYWDWQVHLGQIPARLPLATSKIAHTGPAEITTSLFLL